MEDKQLMKTSQNKSKKHIPFCWQLPVILKGWKQELTEDDLYTPLKEFESRRLGDELERLWQDEEQFSKNPSLTTALWKLVRVKFMLYGFVLFVFKLTSFTVQPLCLRKILDYHTSNQTDVSLREAYTYAGISATTILLFMIVIHWTILQLTLLGLKVRIACSSLIFRRALKLKQSSLGKVPIGHVINLLSNDVNRFETCLPFLPHIWIAPVNLIIVTCILDFTLGHTATCGIGVLVIFVIFQMYSMKMLSSVRRNVAEKTDYRVRLMNDVICGIQAIKMYTWEKPYMKLIHNVRKQEMNKVVASNHIRVLNLVFRIYISKLGVYLSILVTTLMGLPLTSQYVFVMFNIYETLKMSTSMLFQHALGQVAETNISIQRIQSYLLHDHQTLTPNVDSIATFRQDKYQTKPGISLKSVSIKWNSASPSFTLSDVNFEASPGELVAIAGATGSGKSTLLYAILNEVDVIKGNIELEGTISYASQEPWIFSASIKQNILFGEDFNRLKYLKVLKACALEHDLAMFPHGDQTRVGERGVMLSGGQKARIGLARAVYRDADVYLLDDPLSAVDSQVARHIFNDCVCGYLKTKCVILVTHQIQFLKRVNRVYLIESQTVYKCNEDTNFANFGKYFVDDVSKTEETQPNFVELNQLQVETKEHRSSDATLSKAYKGYVSAGNLFLTCVIFCSFVIGLGINISVDYFLALWVDAEQGDTVKDWNFLKFLDKSCYLYVYTVLLVLLVLSSHGTSCLFVTWSKSISNNLHNVMLQRIVNATVTFFNEHSSGRILNRFTKDIGIVDEIIPPVFMAVLTSLSVILSVLCLIIFSNYWIVFPIVLVVLITIGFKMIFQHTSSSLKRTEAVTRSAALTHLSASVQGLPIIRAFGLESKIVDEFDYHESLHSSAFYLFATTFAAFSFWTDVVCALFNILVIFSFLFIKVDSSAGFVGLAITQSMMLVRLVQYTLKNWGDLEARMVSVERIIEYTEIEVESNAGVAKVAQDWPTTGKLSFVSVSLQYSPDTPFVLKNISFEIKHGEKIGIVGRTGAGKTSLTSVLFRLFHHEGDVFIDGVNTKTISLDVLRSKITIIPQDPVLFLGTLRKNIDPFDDYTDHEIWSCLDELELKEMVSKLSNGLESQISEKGSNFSFGEKQLLCLVRAMLRNNKLIVLDEATANVDLKTDELIQAVIRRKFRHCTVLTVAHRLNTVIDSDRILVLDDGSIVEFDHPFLLLQNTEGFFYEYIKQYGNAVVSEFKASAEYNYRQLNTASSLTEYENEEDKSL
ncbi:ATP-binding cassette sub-family C member 4-like isoform X1 [Zophobas morio]|uniref:ATP-binding cassette sub-family C member 4-like isoform X1 n=2 Tax=Zophobas morio TaxID=2755281 RepID=UPI003083502E